MCLYEIPKKETPSQTPKDRNPVSVSNVHRRLWKSIEMKTLICARVTSHKNTDWPSVQNKMFENERSQTSLDYSSVTITST